MGNATGSIPTFLRLRSHLPPRRGHSEHKEGKKKANRLCIQQILHILAPGAIHSWAGQAVVQPSCTGALCEVMDSSLCFPHCSCLSWQCEGSLLTDPQQDSSPEPAANKGAHRGSAVTRPAPGVPSLGVFQGDKMHKDWINAAKSF